MSALDEARACVARLEQAMWSGALQEGTPAARQVIREVTTLTAILSPPPCSLVTLEAWTHGRDG